MKKHSWFRRAASVVAAVLLGSAVVPALATAEPAAAAPIPATITVGDGVVQDDFLGIGVNLIPVSLMPNNRSKGYNEAYWEVDAKRIQTLEPKVARVWFQPDWVETEKGVYTFDSEKMLAFYEYLDVLEAAGTEIELNYGWKVGREIQDWFSIPGVPARISAPADLEAFAAGASALLEELITERGYDNIKYLAFYNEPNGSWDFEAPNEVSYYAEMVREVHDRLVTDGRRDLVEIWGPEEWGAVPWTQYMHANIDDVLDAYTFHVYGGTYDSLSTQFSSRQNIIGDKPLVLSEFGFSGNYDSWWESSYANYVIKMANEGVRAGLIWQLNGVWIEDPDEDTDTNDTYTLWDSLLATSTPNPRFYEAGLLARYVPEHSQVLEVETDSSDVRATAFRTGDDYTIVVETNEGADTRELTVDFATAVDATFHKFVYNDSVSPEENALLPASVAEIVAGSSFTDSVNAQRNVVIYTTLEPETQVALSPANAVVTGGETIDLDAEVIDGPSGVTWSVVGDQGSVDSSGVYTAPPVDEPTRVAVRATSANGGYGVALLHVLPAASDGRVAQPVFALAGGTYVGPQSVAITSATEDATIHYTIDGTEPDATAETYSGPVELIASAVLKAIAVKDGLDPSPTTSTLYRVLPDPGGPEGYTLCATEDQTCGFPGTATVAYGANGNYSYGVFESRVRCSGSTFGGDPAPGVSKKCFYLLSDAERAAKPFITPAGGTYSTTQSVTIATTTPEAEIRYTVDGSLPTASSTLYTGAIEVSSSRNIKAIAVAPGLAESPIAVAVFNVVDTSGGPDGYTYCAGEFATCVLDGPAIVAFGANGSFSFSAFADDVQCAAANFGGTDPAPGHAKKCFFAPLDGSTVSPPTFSPAPGSYGSAQDVAISTTTAGAEIRYTTDGSTPSSSSTLYTGPVAVTETTTIKAIAVKDGLTDSPVVIGTYQITTGGGGGNGGPDGYTFCADEFQTCNFTGSASVAFGANGSFFFQTLENSTLCTTTVFGGDPAFNQAKKCYYHLIGENTVAMPVFAPVSGTYSEPQSVTITTATEGASIHVTTDGSTPTTSSPLYTGALSVTATTTVKALAAKDGMDNSPIVTANYAISASTVSAPAFSPPGGTYATGQTVTLTTATSGAEIRYTTNGSTPTIESTLYTGAITVATTSTIMAVAFKEGLTPSSVATAVYTISSAAGGPEGYTECANEFSFCNFSGTASVAFGANGSFLYNTFTNSAPCSADYFGGIDPAPNQPKKCYYLVGGQGTVATPGFTPPGGTYSTAQSVTIATSTLLSQIRYTTDGSTPTAESALYESPLTISETTTVKAVAFKDGLTDSAVATAIYTIQPAAGGPEGYTECANEFGDCVFSGTASVAFGANGSFNYGTFTNSVQCVVANFGGTDPAFNQAKKCYYQLLPPGTVSSPTFSPEAGTYAGTQLVTIATATEGAEIRYTLDGSQPVAESTLYTGAITISTDTTVSAIALKTGMTASPVVTAAYVIVPHVVAAPTISPAGGAFTGSVEVTLASATEGAEIRYTLNGDAPTAGSTLYTGPFTIAATATVNAIALKAAMTDSSVTSATFTISDPDPELELSTGTAKPGESLTVSGSGFDPDETLEIWLNSTPVLLLTTSANGSGAFSAVVQIPTDVAPGQHTIRVIGLSSGIQLSLPLTITSELGATGTAIAWFGILIAISLIAAGSAALLVRRRRQPLMLTAGGSAPLSLER